MDTIEQTGRTVQDAVNSALKALGITREEAEVEVLAEESRGLLGILGYSAAKVRVTKKQRPEGEREPVSRAQQAEPRPARGRVAEAAPGEYSELALRAAEVVTQIVTLMGIEAQTEITADDAESVSINLHSDQDLGLLIGKRGQTLEALQLVVAMMANRGLLPEQRRRVVIDAEGYRVRRERALQAMARSAAQRAKRNGRPVTINSLTARERRVVHLTLADDPAVTTRSEGEDPDRSIIITPRRRATG